MRRLLKILIPLAILAMGIFWFLTAPNWLANDPIYASSGDAVAGERIYRIAGCGACHMAKGSTGEDQLRLVGGQAFSSPFGTFIAPNISPDLETGIGGWSTHDLANALLRGISPSGTHYYPVLPYAAYARMSPSDVVDLKAFLDTLPAVAQTNAEHDLPLPFRLRRGLGLWKLLFLNDAPVIADAPEEGRYLVEALGHCAECHTPRNLIGGLQTSLWLAGAPHPSGTGRIPNITPGGLVGWSAADIVYYLQTGFTPEFDTAGGEMVEVIANLSKLSDEDLANIADYLQFVPPHTSPPR